MTITGPGRQHNIYTLKEVIFSHDFYDESAGTLAQTATTQSSLLKVSFCLKIDILLCQVINEKERLSAENSEFEGI